MLPAARPAPVIQCRQNGDESETNGNKINVGPIQKHWRFTRAISGEMREAAHRCEVRSETPLGRTASGLSLVTPALHDEIRLYRLQLGIPQTLALVYPGGVSLD